MTKEYQGVDPGEPGDAEAMAAVRSGDTGAFDVLYRRHVRAARRMARVLSRDSSDVDDLVAEAFARVLAILSAGRGPEAAFRPYLFTTMRHLAYERTRQERRLQVTDDMTRHEVGVPFIDTAVEALEMSLVSKAFASLPERWQTVLWHTEVEKERPSKVAPLLGLTPNGVAALAYRAREGLRQQYLQEHIAAEPADECRWAIERLGAYVRGGLARRDTAKVDAHLAGCRRCHVLFVELGEVSARMRDLLAPALVASGYFAGVGKMVWLAPVVKVAKRRDAQVTGGVVAVAALAALALLLTSQQAVPPGGTPPAAIPVQPPQVVPTPVVPTPAPVTPDPATPPTSRAPEAGAILEASLEPVGALVLGRPGTLVMSVAHRGMTTNVAFGPRAYRVQPAAPDTGPLTAVLTLPPGVTVRGGDPGDGWRCTGTTCNRGSLSAGQNTRAYVPVDVSGTAADGDLSVRLTAPRASATSAVRLGDIREGGLAATYAATTRATVITGGNRLMSCATLPLLGCLGLGVDNGDYYMTRYCDPAAPGGGGLPHGAAVSGAQIPVHGELVWAGLYWSASGKPPAEPAAHVRVPGAETYVSVPAARVDRAASSYQAFADITTIARGTPGGMWWVAVEHGLHPGVGSYGGWALMLVVANGGPPRHVAVMDGFHALQASSVSTPVYGTPEARATLAFIGWEGDRGIAGDRLRLGDRALGGDNIASSSTDGTPAGWNTFGVDARLFDTRLPAGPDQPEITAAAKGDAWILGVLAVASES